MADGAARDGVVGVFDIGGDVGVGWADVEEKLEAEASSDATVGRAAVLVKGFKEGEVLGVYATSDVPGDVPTGDGVAAKGAAGGGLEDLLYGLGIAWGVKGFDELALGAEEFSGEAKAVVVGDVAEAYLAEPEAKEAEGVRAREDEFGGEARGAGGAGVVGLELPVGFVGYGVTLGLGEPAGREGAGWGVGGKVGSGGGG